MFCLSHNIDPGELELTLQLQEAFNGSRSTITEAEAQTGIPDTAGIAHPNSTLAAAFRANPGANAAASLNGTDVYFRGGGFLSGIFGNSAIREGTIEHEALHNMFLKGDTSLQNMLGLPENTADTSNITKALEDNHCTH